MNLTVEQRFAIAKQLREELEVLHISYGNAKDADKQQELSRRIEEKSLRLNLIVN